MNATLLHPQATGFQAAKVRCLACEATGVEITREHFWPKWLIGRTGSRHTGVRWLGGKKISPTSATIPLCAACNHQFGAELEAHVLKIFDSLETGGGISDFQAELLVRWMWKFEGFGWLLNDTLRTYSHISTLRNRVLNRLGSYRSSVCLALSLIDHIDPSFGDSPMGIDSENQCNCIFVSGVFSRVAIVVLLSNFSGLLPKEYSVYHFEPTAREVTEHASLFRPRVGFQNDVEAVGTTRLISLELSRLHDKFARSSES